jgi:peptidoglycan lytic transglycosylase G
VTIRSGGSPRGGRDGGVPNQAHPMEPEWTAPRPDMPTLRGSGRSRFSRGGGLGGLLRFLLFSLVLAVIVLLALVTVLRPLISGAIVGWAADNPSALGIPFVADMVRQDLGDSLTTAPSTDATQADFVVEEGDSARSIAGRLAEQGFLKDPRAFVFTAIQRNIESDLEAGTFILRRNMTPDELVTALLQVKDRAVDVALREGLRLEQVVAKLETLPLTMDVSKFYDLVKHPTPKILADHPWLKLPKGASLEGFLAPATYHVPPEVTPEELIDKMLQAFTEQMGADRMDVPKTRGMTFYQVVTLASLVEREAVVDEERPLIAGVYQNRLNPKRWPTGQLQADPTVFYGHDTLELAKLKLPRWTEYTFWAPFGGGLSNVQFPPELQGFQTYQTRGLMPGPICTPSVASIDAALEPNTKKGYLFFVAKQDGSNTHAFARTPAEHEANLVKYGYR